MAVHVEESGSGEPLLLIHGWGMHGGMWGEVAASLAQDFRVMAVDLPGHGFSAGRDLSRHHCSVGINPDLLDAIVDALSVQFNEPLTVCGWSLGGQVALRWAAREPEKIRRLALVASTPCFVRREGWDCAMAAETLEQFSAALQQDYAATLRRFLALQVRGSANERELLARLREALFSRGEPDMEALRAGLEILRDCDLRASLPGIKQPVLVIAGERDTLTPPQAARYAAECLPDARLEIVEGAAHAPFLSHPEKFVGSLKRFLSE